jgi:tetratricopeptide (TPR) repeat protein
VVAQDRELDLNSIRSLCATAAREQYAGHKAGELMQSGIIGQQAYGGYRFANAANLYHAALVLAEELDSGKVDTVESRTIISALYARVAWFASRTNMSGYLKIDYNQLLERAVSIDPDNALALYMSVRLKSFGSEENIDEVTLERLNRALKKKPDFPEAYLLLGLYYLRNGDQENADKCKSQFLANVDAYSPELIFYDTTYPAPNNHIMISENQRVESRDYPKSAERFRLN